LSLTEIVKAGDYEFEIKRFSLRERSLIQAKMVKTAGVVKAGEENVDIDWGKFDFLEFQADSIFYGIKSAKYKGEEINVTREWVESLDWELAEFLFHKIRALNERRFFSTTRQ
jgi:hypothetical protein